MKINVTLLCKASRYSKAANSRKYIVIHNTANTASARAEALNCNRNDGQSSFHYVLDGSEIYASVPTKYTAWSVGAWSGCEQLIGNGESISIEVCSDCKEFTKAQKEQLRELVRYLMQEYKIPKSHVVRHYDCHTGRKRCPYAYSGTKTNDAKWETLRNYLCDDTYKYVPVQIYNSNCKDAQQWQIIADKDGYCNIINRKYGQVLDCQHGAIAPSTPVGVWDSNGSDCQKWRLLYYENERCFEIVNKKSGLALDLKGGNCDASTPLQIYTRNNSKAQRFAIIPIDGTWNWIVSAKACKPLEIKGGGKSKR